MATSVRVSPLPFAPTERYQPNLRFADLIRQQGQDAANSELRRGDLAAQMWGNLGQTIGSTVQGIQQNIQKEKAAEPQRKLTELQITDAKNKIAADARDLKETAALTDLFSHPDKVTPEAVYGIVGPKRGADILKGISALTEQNQQTFKSTKEVIGAMTGAVLALPKNLQADAYAHSRENLIQRGLVKPEDVPEVFDPNYLQQAHIAAMTPDKQEEVLNPKPVSVTGVGLVKPNTGEVVVAQPENPNVAETARHNKEMEAIGRMTAGRQAAAAAETARHNRAIEQAGNPLAALQGANRSAPSAGAAQGPTGEDFLKSLPPNIASEVKAYAEGRRPFPAGFALKSPYFQSLIQMVGQYDPTFDAANYNARSKARTDLTSPSGMGGKTINALNTAIQHAGRLSDIIETLDNTEYPIANAIINPLRTATGSTKVTNFKAVAPQLAKEIERAWRGAGGSTADIKQLIESIGGNLGKQQQREALMQFVELAQGKLTATETQRDNVLGPAGESIPVLFGENKPILAKILKRAEGAGGGTADGHQVGDSVTLKNGSTVVIKKLNPDGTFEF